jgi:hypothetical protein
MPQFASAEDAFHWQTTELDGQLRRLSGGETGARLDWFVPLVKELQQSPAIRTVRSGSWTNYDDVDRLGVRRNATLSSAGIPLRLAEWALEELDLLDRRGTPATYERPLQIGVPGYLDMALFIFGPVGAVRHGSAFLAAVAAQIETIVAAAGDRVVFQLETPAALIAVTSAPRPLRGPLADVLARRVLRQVSAAPAGTRFGLHLCLGDMGHHAKTQLPSAAPLVQLANALDRRWPASHQLDYLHLPLSGGKQPPSTDPSFFGPLRGLKVSTTVVAGIAHEEQSTAEQYAVRALVEDALGHPVDIATACGLGRRTPAEALGAVAAMQALLAR